MDYNAALKDSLIELVKKTVMRDNLEHEMGKLHLAIGGLLHLVDDKAEQEAWKAILDVCKVRIGLSDLILQFLSQSDRPMTPIEIRRFIVNYGGKASALQSLPQSIHILLKRMKGDRLKEELNKEGEKAYRLLTFTERMAKAGVGAEEAALAQKKIRERLKDVPAGANILVGFPDQLFRKKKKKRIGE